VTTPDRLRAYVAAVWVAALLLFAVALAALRADRASLRTIARTAAPNIVLAQTLGVHLADLDAELANMLLGKPDQRETALARFQDQRSIVSFELVDAASTAASNDEDRRALITTIDELGRYYDLAARARWTDLAGDRTAAVATLRQATDHMHARVIPSAATLDRVDRALMDREYDDAARASKIYEGEATVCGLILLAVLLGAQTFVRRKMRRRFVPGLFAATLLAACFVVYLVGRFHLARENFRIARDDAFNSVHVLWKASAIAYDARGDESRWLLGDARSDENETAFVAKTKQLVSKAGPWRVGSREVTSGQITGLLVDEARNVTFQGESAAVDALMTAFAAYIAADDRVRALSRQGRQADAIERCVGLRQDDARAAFERFDVALQRTIDINQRAFDAACDKSDLALARAEWLDPAFALAIAVLAWLGVRARVREYA
jgi:hypothetical protein